MEVSEDVLGDFADAVLRHPGEDRVPQLAASQRTRPSHAVT